MATGNVAAEQLRLFIERIERLEEEKKGIADDIKDVYAEAKGQGFDSKTIREIIKLRKMDPQARREREALLDTYKAALGMLDGTPLGRWALERLAGETEPPASDAEEELFVNAARLVVQHKKASTSWLQRTLRLGFATAAGLIERMEREGLVSKPDAKGKRTVTATAAPEPKQTKGEAPASPPEPETPAPPPPPELTIEDARKLGKEAAHDGKPVTANPFPARDPRRAAWDEAWCAALGSDGMDIPGAFRPSNFKPKKDDGEPKPGEGGGE